MVGWARARVLLLCGRELVACTLVWTVSPVLCAGAIEIALCSRQANPPNWRSRAPCACISGTACCAFARENVYYTVILYTFCGTVSCVKQL